MEAPITLADFAAEIEEMLKGMDYNTNSIRLGRTLGELLETPSEPRVEVIRGLTMGEAGILLAVTNVGKSTLLRNLALSKACGREFTPLVTAGPPTKVVLVDSEDYCDNLKRDLQLMLDGFSDKDKRLVQDNLLVISDVQIDGGELQLNRPDHLTALISEVRKFGAALTLIDTISRAFVIHNENDNSEVKESVMKPLHQLSKQAHTATLAAHHIGKSKMEEGSAREGSHRGRGASSFGDQSRVIFNLDRDKISNEVILSCPKIKGRQIDSCGYSLNQDTRWLEHRQQVKLETSYDKVLRYFDDGESHESGSVIRAFTDLISVRQIKHNLKRAVESGGLERIRQGVYRKPNLCIDYSESAESAQQIRK